MVWRVLGGTLVLLALGVAGGYAVAAAGHQDAVASGVPQPIGARSPAYPIPTSVSVEPDPTTPALGSGLSLMRTRLDGPDGPGTLGIGIPDGWVGGLTGPSTYQYIVPGSPKNTYLLRIVPLSGTPGAPSGEIARRVSNLRSAQSDGNMSDLRIRYRTKRNLIVEYVDSAGFRRVSAERWLTRPGSIGAFVNIAAVGRVEDLDGLTDLLERVSQSVRTLPVLDPSASASPSDDTSSSPSESASAG